MLLLAISISVSFFVSPMLCLQCNSPILGTFFKLATGVFSNSGDPGRLDPACPQDVIEIKVLPVAIPALENLGFTLLSTDTVNDVIVRQDVLVIWLDDERLIHIQPHKIIDTQVLRGIGQVNLTSLSSLKADSFKTRPECEVIFRPVESNSFVAAWPDCTGFFTGGIPFYTITLSCNAHAFVSTLNLFPEKSCNIPYVIWVKERFPLPLNMKYSSHDSVDPCTCKAK